MLTSRTIKRLAALSAAALLTASLSAPAQALGLPNITPETTIGELRANESIIASGFDTLEQSIYWKEQPWEYVDWTLQEYVGDSAPDTAAGLNLLIDYYNRGGQVTYKVYTPEEIAADPSKNDVELYYFPAENGNTRYALVVPGNMFERSAKMKEGCSAAYHLHEMGYSCFILRYRIGQNNAGNAAYNDLVRAVQYLTEHADSFGLNPEQYALVGYSAGGQMCGVFGSDRMGYSNYGLPQPEALLLTYPVINYAYIKPLYFYMMDGAKPGDYLAPGDYYYNIEVDAEVTPNYPPTYHWFGLDDTMLLRMNLLWQGPALEKALDKNGVMHRMRIYLHAPHGIGTGIGTDANGWIYDAVAFWEEVVAARHSS